MNYGLLLREQVLEFQSKYVKKIVIIIHEEEEEEKEEVKENMKDVYLRVSDLDDRR